MKHNKETLVLARTIYGEARGEGQTGMQAVANVVMNRVNQNTWYGDGVIEVCMKPGHFSTWNEGDPNAAIIRDMEPGDNAIFDVAFNIATQAIAGDLDDITRGADHYYNPNVVAAYWAHTKRETAVIGNHRFMV